ncbi:MAG TPA: hypothetical protein PLO61_03230 [Fimbriimonadaceae bacterium]|nr:hypothetical protein [Fimbriimonadaceae bacterium]HRJ32644.1 hypothetical protein [Fimbriimonadaceae bacterium]
MRYTKKDLHPQIFESIYRFTSSMSMGAGQNPAIMGAYLQHNKVWWKEYGKAWMIGLGVWTASFFGLMGLGAVMNSPALLGISFATIPVGIAVGIRAYMKTRYEATVEELELLLPLMDLSEEQRQYLVAFISLCRAQGLDAAHRQEIMEQLMTLLDEAERLKKQRATLVDLLGATDQRESVLAEIARLQKRYEEAQDPEAKETFQISLEVAQKRLDRFTASAPMLERIEAQQELVRQTMASFREVLNRMQSTPTRDLPGLDGLRNQISRIQSQGNALESAYEEIRAWG